MSETIETADVIVKDKPSEVELEKALLEHAKEKGVPEEELPSDLKALEAAEAKSGETESDETDRSKPEEIKSAEAEGGRIEYQELKTSPLRRAEATPPSEPGKPVTEPVAERDAKPESTDVKKEGSPAETKLYEDIQLPPTAKGASARAFAELKARAAADLQARDKQIAELQERIKALEEAAQKHVSPEEYERLKKENEALKEWQAKLDVEADPAWAEKYDKRIQAAEELIYSQLKSAGASDAVIDRIKELGGPSEVDFDPIFEKLNNPSIQRIIQRKLDEIEEVKLERQAELNKAKERVSEYIEQRRKEFIEASNKHNIETETALKDLLSKQEYLKKYDLKNAVSDEERAEWEAHNKWVDEVYEVVKEALSDTSPTMRALLISGVAQYMHLRRQYELQQKERETLENKIKSLEQQLKEATGKLAKVKEASLSAVRRTSAPVHAEPVETPVSQLLTKTAEEAFDEYLRSRAAAQP